MNGPLSGTIFSDLDGTFLDAGYQPALGAEALAEVRARWRVVWVSSRTAEELLHLQQQLAHPEDAIGENGGVLLTRDPSRARLLGAPVELFRDSWGVVTLATRRDETVRRVREAFSAVGLTPRTLTELTPDELAERSGYARDDAVRALRRRTSVLLTDVDAEDERAARALAALRNAGCAVAHGGQWISVVHGADKGTAVRTWLEHWTRSPATAHMTVAIGDADNDEPLLRAAQRRFVIRHPDRGHAPRLAGLPGAQLLERAGTAGWHEMLERLGMPAEATR